MRTLLVHYTPNKKSKTKLLLEAFHQTIGHLEVDELDLCRDVPDLFSVEALEAYYARIDGVIPPNSSIPVLAKMDRMTAQLKACDVVVIAFPIYNFSMPATVKAWFDSVMLHGETFVNSPQGGYRGLMAGKKALALLTASGTYSIGTDGKGGLFGPTWEHGLSLAMTEFRFMGFSDIRGVLAESMARGREVVTCNLNAAIEQVQSITREWYGDELLIEHVAVTECPQLLLP